MAFIYNLHKINTLELTRSYDLFGLECLFYALSKFNKMVPI